MTQAEFSGSSIELFLSVGLDGAVGGGVGDAGEDEAVAHLVVIEEGLVGLVDGTGLLRLGRVAWARGEAVSARPNVRRSFILNCGYNVFLADQGARVRGGWRYLR